MASCIFCKANTELNGGGAPVCAKCSEEREAKNKPPGSEHQVPNVLREDVQSATEQAMAATAAFEAVTGEIPSPLPHPDRTQRIHNPSRVVSQARVELTRAHDQAPGNSGDVKRPPIPESVMEYFRKTGAMGGMARAKKHSKAQLSEWAKLRGRATGRGKKQTKKGGK